MRNWEMELETKTKHSRLPPEILCKTITVGCSFSYEIRHFYLYTHSPAVRTDISTHQVTTISVCSTYLYTYAMKTIWWEAIQYKRDYRKLEVTGVYITEQLGKLI